MKKSNKTVRLTGIPEGETRERIEAEALADSKFQSPKWKKFFKSSSNRSDSNTDAASGLLGTSLAQQRNFNTATITFATSAAKERALYTRQKRHNKVSNGTYIDDDFRGITILHSGSTEQRVDLDICAVHGLNGHAFDTWMSRSQMWLRDYLPNHTEFRNSRIMTYGYDSQLLNGKGTQSRFEDFADQLLVLIGQERTTPEERARPVLFLCHSMGGLIARLAMVRYEKYPKLHPGVVLGPRGLLLLSTPNLGSLMAQWSDLELELANVFGVQTSLIKELKVLNPRHIDAVNDWATLQYQPLIRCYCESSPTSFPGGGKQVVTAASAGFLEHTAMLLPETDHHSVCKFEKYTSPAFTIVMGGLFDMRSDLMSRANQLISTAVRRVGRPEASAPTYPLPKPFVFNHGFRKPSYNVVRRQQLLKEATKNIHTSASSRHMLILVGVAGSGKTELLLDIVGAGSNFVVLPASNYAALRTKLEEYALMYGHDTIRHGAIDPRSLDIWKTFTPKVQADSFLSWAAREENDCVIMLDELDNLKDASDIARDLPQTARVVVSTRNPVVSKQLARSGFQCLDLLVSDMEWEEAEQLLRSSIASTVTVSPDQLSRLVESLDRHPFAICAASSYLPDLQRIQDPSEQDRVVEVLLNALEGDDVQGRRDFFDFDGLLDLSISKLFGTAMNHLKNHTTNTDYFTAVRPFLQAIAHLSDHKSGCHFTVFFNAVQPIAAKNTIHEIDNVFKKSLRQENSMLGKVLQSSLVVERPGKSYMPALWRDCIMLYESKPPKKVTYWLKQILLLCYLHYDENKNNENNTKLYPFVRNCKRIAKRYGISSASIITCPEQRPWHSHIVQSDDASEHFWTLLAECREATTSVSAERPGSDFNFVYARLTRQYKSLKERYPAYGSDSATSETVREIENILTRAAESVGNPVWSPDWIGSAAGSRV